MFHIVDDTLVTCDLMEEVIRHHGYRALSFTSPDGYLDYVRSSRYKVPIAAFVDVRMPSMNGYELMHEVSKASPRTRFVVMSGEPGIRSEHAGKACMYLAKPIRPHDIVKAVDSLIRCYASSPDETRRCRCADQRHHFESGEWHCPQRHLFLN